MTRTILRQKTLILNVVLFYCTGAGPGPGTGTGAGTGPVGTGAGTGTGAGRYLQTSYKVPAVLFLFQTSVCHVCLVRRTNRARGAVVRWFCTRLTRCVAMSGDLHLHLTVRIPHMVFFLVALVALWNVQHFFEPRRKPSRQYRSNSELVPHRRDYEPPSGSPSAQVAPPGPPSSVQSDTPRLTASRGSVEPAPAFSLPAPTQGEVELLYWLKRNRTRFQAILSQTSLGLSSHSSVQLLRELSRRSDLAGALRETGLGAGADFQCDFDESPRDGGCQVRCTSAGRRHASTAPCARAHEKCRQLGHCVSIDENRDHTWATLKSLQVYMPRPPPVCDGYAFHANGSAPIAIGAPLAIDFDDLAGEPFGAPNEAWCYRDTTVREPSPVPRTRQPGDRCTLETCFDLARCRAATAAADAFGPSLYIDTPTPVSFDMRRWPSCMRQTLQGAIVPTAAQACLVVPTVNLNCEWDVCDPSTHEQLRAMPSWNQSGRNHLIWDYIDAHHIKYAIDDALIMKTSMRLSDYRPGFDVPFPLLPNGEASHVTPEELRLAASRRTLLASFKGTCQSKSRRGQLARLHDNKQLIMLCSGSPGYGQWDYKTLMLTSVFSVAPAGNGLHSFRLAEAIFFGSIPVVVDDEIVLPFCGALDWRRFSVRIRQADIPRLPQILRAIPPATVAQMQARLAQVKERYFLYPFNTALALMRLRLREAMRRQGTSAR